MEEARGEGFGQKGSISASCCIDSDPYEAQMPFTENKTQRA